MKAQFYSYPNGYHHTLHHHHNNNNNYSHNNNEESQQSDTSTSITDLSVLSPNLKSYLHHGTSTSNNSTHCNSALDGGNGNNSGGDGVLSPILPNNINNNNNVNIINNNEQEVYSPHMAALTSPPTMHYNNINNDGLLHSIFSAKKNRAKRRGRRRVGGGISKNMSDNMSGDKSGARGGGKSNYNGVEEEDVLGMFSPGVHEFDIDEALANDLDDEEESSVDGFTEDGGNDRVTNNIVGRMNDDEVTLDSVDRIVRGDYLKRNQIKFDNGMMRGMGTSPMKNDAVLTKSLGGVKDGVVKTPIGRSEEVKVSPGLQQRTTPSNYSNIFNNNTTTTNNNVANSKNNNNNSNQEEQEQFYTPIQQKTNRKQRQLSTTSSRGTTKSKSSLAPLWEEKEITTSFREEDITPPFKTPKEFHRTSTNLNKSGGSDGMYWNVVQQEEEEEEEFFSPLAQHHHDVEIVSPMHHQEQWNGVVEESCSDAVVKEWRGNDAGREVHAANEIDRSKQNEQQQLQQQQTHQQKVTSPPMASPQYSEMRQELQQMLVEARKLTPSKEDAVVSNAKLSPMNGLISNNDDDDKENIQPVMTVSEEINADSFNDAELETSSPPATLRNSINASPPSTTPNSHHRRRDSHSSPPTPNLLPEHLTLDYVKECTCYDTLQEILTRLSSQEDGSGGKRLRYPSMVRYVEKRMRVLAESFVDEEEVEVLVDEGLDVGDELVVDGDVLPEGLTEEHRESSDELNETLVQDVQRSLPPALETNTLPEAPPVDNNEQQAEDNFRHRQITPEHHSIEERSESIMTHETSLDMNLSESLEDESFFWKQDAGKLDNLETWESTLKSVEDNEDVPVAATYQVDEDVPVTMSPPEDSTFIPPVQNERYIELEEKLSKSVAAQAELTIKIESLMKEHDTIKAELTAKLDEAREELSQQRIHASNEKEEHSKNISELRQVNQRLEDEISSLKIQLEAVNKKANDAARQLELELEERKLIESKLSQENERLGQELDEARLARDRAAAEESRWKEMLNEHIANADEKNNNATKRFKKGLEAAKFANHALANALAISEKDLSEALRQKEKSVRECNSLQQRALELEDKSSWLSSKVNTMTQELESSRKYIDTLYADLQSSRSPSKEMKDEMERKELQWLELERQYTNHIRKLEGQKISRADYVAVLRQSQKHQSEAAQKQQVVEELQSTITSLEQQIESMSRRPPSRNSNAISKPMTSRGKSTTAMRSYGKKVQNVPSRNTENDENKAPSSDYRERVPSSEVGGKKMRRSSALKAVGGRKGLSEQLRRARRAGEETR